ncbi:CPP1-like family protein [Gloeobacter kilaueensis]|uniref:Molecular chaperone DnaJ n=1 Tax=Gloeobacter kilaueensis (strain ATCC BAA-2537 / CCAP 1431/1 / ULC 316 / JS1) TaxID=1183438 RepID=U5QRC5_GLOK1|nr:CPP1-like family protein [Gloeobacter kilaueensis]AGY60204.1 hypothetical protein GKIL_3958 [Gloeobacter kilaueensis JS1]
MSEPNPYHILGIAENAPFEEVQEARVRLLSEFALDEKRQRSIEIAYDAILMQRLKLRQDGKIKVKDGIRYADRTVVTRPAQTLPTRPARQWWRGLSVAAPEASISALVFSAIWLLYLALSSSTPGNDGSYAIALGLFATLYFLYRRIRVFWKAGLYALGAVVLAILASSSLASIWPGQAVPAGVTGFVLIAILWLVTLLAR